MWNNISNRDSLDTCSVIRWYIDPTNNPPATDADRAIRFEQMRSTAFQNGLECGLPLIE